MKNTLASQIVEYYKMYENYIWENSMKYNPLLITVEQLIEFVEKNIILEEEDALPYKPILKSFTKMNKEYATKEN